MAKRTLILVRHGQYHKASADGIEHLTALGRKQAKLAGRRLGEYGVDRLIHSTMPRAKETASIIQKELRFGPMKSCASLRECLPGMPGQDEGHIALAKAQADLAYSKYFRASRTEQVDVLVCHGNIIRYLICRLLEVDTARWLQMDVYQCGISIVELTSTGSYRRQLISHNDIGHIPVKLRTFI